MSLSQKVRRGLRVGLLLALPLGSAPLLALHGHANSHVQAKTNTDSTLPSVTIRRLAIDTDSVKVEFQPVAGAKDYRIYERANPAFVKYAGQIHLREYRAQTRKPASPRCPPRRSSGMD